MSFTHDRSHEIFTRAQQLMPGGVNSPARAFGAVGGEPVIMHHGEHGHLYDVDGNRYVDFIGSWGPMIIGHRHPRVVAALHEAIEQGTSFGAPTERENELAELVIDAVPSIDKVRLVNSGTEATMSAIRLARGATNRELIVKFAGNYHGHVDSLLVAAGSSAATLGVPNSPGVTSGAVRDTIVLPYNDPERLEDAFDEHGDKIAAVIFEPVVGNMGTVIPSEDFLGTLQQVTKKHGALLIADEVMTGFRVAYGGAQSLFDFDPDITALGKIIGGGLPVGAYGGKKEVMDQVLPAGKVFQAGTLSGNPLATAAGVATLRELKEHPPYEYLEKLSQHLANGLVTAAKDANIPHTLTRVGSMMTLFFHDQPVRCWDDAAKCDTDRFAKYFWGLLQRGIYMPCSQYEALFVSAAHTEGDIDQAVEAAHMVLAECR